MKLVISFEISVKKKSIYTFSLLSPIRELCPTSDVCSVRYSMNAKEKFSSAPKVAKHFKQKA